MSAVAGRAGINGQMPGVSADLLTGGHVLLAEAFVGTVASGALFVDF